MVKFEELFDKAVKLANTKQGLTLINFQLHYCNYHDAYYVITEYFDFERPKGNNNHQVVQFSATTEPYGLNTSPTEALDDYIKHFSVSEKGVPVG